MDAMQARRQIGASIKRKRKEAGYRSAETFASLLDMSRSRYYEYEQGRVALPFDVAWRIADILHCSLDELGGRDFQPAAAYSDPRQQALNHSYSLLDEKSKDDLTGIASTFTADPSRRAAKSGQGAEPVVEGEGAA